MVCGGPYFTPINSNYQYYMSSNDERNNTSVSSRKIINGCVHLKFYYYNDIIPYYLRKIPQNNLSSLLPLHAPTELYDNIMDENNRREGIEF